MKLTFPISIDDHLIYHLYTSYAHGALKKQVRLSLFLGIGVFIVFSFYINRDQGFLHNSVTFGLCTMIWLVLSPKWVRYKIKRRYKRFLKKHHQGRINQTVEAALLGDILEINTEGNRSQIALSQIDQIIELPEHYLILFRNNSTLILPIYASDDYAVHDFVDELSGLKGIQVKNEQKWKW